MNPTRHEQRLLLAASIVVLLAAAAAVLWHAQVTPLEGDEHAFVASGALLAREGSWPILHYPSAHLPNAALLYALVFTHTDNLLAAARAAAGLCAAATLVLLFAVALRRFDMPRASLRLLLAAGAVVLMLSCPLFFQASGKATGDDLAALLCVTAVTALLHAAAKLPWGRPVMWAALAGVALGVAMGTRAITAVVLVVALASLPLLPKGPYPVRSRMALALLGGAAAGLTPVWTLLIKRPAGVWFTAVELPLSNLAVKQVAPGSLPGWWSFKLEALRGVGESPTLLALLVGVGVLSALGLWGVWRLRDRDPAGPFAVVLAIGSAAAVLLAALLPYATTPALLYPAVPMLVLAAAVSAGWLSRFAGDRGRTLALTVYIGLCVAVFVPGVQLWRGALTGGDMAFVDPPDFSTTAARVRGMVGHGRVLTFTPIPALEAGASVYPQFLSGMRGWRAADELPPRRRDALGLVGPDHLGDFLTRHRPDALLLTPSASNLENLLWRLARQQGYIERKVDGRFVLLTPRYTTATTAVVDVPLE